MAFRTVSPYHNPNMNPQFMIGSAIGNLIGGLLGNNYRERGERKENIADLNAMFPGQDNSGQLPLTTPATPLPNGGLLSGAVTQAQPDFRSGLLGDLTSQYGVISPRKNMPWTAEDAAKADGVMPQPAQQPTQQPTQQDTGWNGVKRNIDQGFRQRLTEAAKTMSREDFAKAKAGWMQQYQMELADAKTQFSKDETARNWDAFNAEKDPKKRAFIGIRNGLNREDIKFLNDPQMDVQMLNVGDKYVMVGKDKFTGQYVDPQTKQPIDPSMLNIGVSPNTKATIENSWNMHVTPSGSAILSANAANGGMSAADKRALDASNSVISGFHSRWKDPITGELRQGYQQDPGFSSYQRALQVQAAFLPQIGGQGGGQPAPQSGDKKSQFISAMVAAGYSQSDAEATWNSRTGGSPAPATPAPTTTYNFMGQTVEGAPVGYQPQLPSFNSVDEDAQRQALLGLGLRR